MTIEKRADEENKAKPTASQTRREFMAGAAASLAINGLTGSAEAQTALQNIYESAGARPNCSIGLPDSRLTELQGVVERSYAKAQQFYREGNLTDEKLAELRDDAYEIEKMSGQALWEYQTQQKNPRIFPPDHNMWTVTHRFQESIRGLMASGLSEQAFNAQSRQLLHEYMEQWVTLNLYADVSPVLARTRVAGYYCGYFGICLTGI